MTCASLDLLKTHLQAVSRLRDPFENSDNLAEVQAYIRNAFQFFGWKIQEDTFVYEGRKFSNIIASWPWQNEIPEVIIGAHFDAVPGSPGADDNASGIAALLEASRLTALAKYRPNVHFIAFNLEEYGMLGSQMYLQKKKHDLKRAKKEGRFHGMLSLEMVGYTSNEKGTQKMPALLRPFYPDTGNFLALVGDRGSEGLLKNVYNSFKIKELNIEKLTVPLRGHLFPEVRLSDHSPFWDEGLPALLVTDTSFFRNPHYHLPSDALETLDLEFLKKVTEGVAHFVVYP